MPTKHPQIKVTLLEEELIQLRRLALVGESNSNLARRLFTLSKLINLPPLKQAPPKGNKNASVRKKGQANSISRLKRKTRRMKPCRRSKPQSLSTTRSKRRGPARYDSAICKTASH
jgi:hypothetical protein